MRHDTGNYVSVGQLGAGTYSFSSTMGALCGVGDQGIDVSGTASLSRSDGAHLSGTFDDCVRAHPQSKACPSAACPIDGSPISIRLDVGSRDLISADLTVTFFDRGHTVAIPDGDRSDEQLAFSGAVVVTRRIGYWMVDASGRIYAFGGGGWHGNAASSTAARDLAPTPSGNGYWVVNVSGQVYSFGDAHWLGNANRATLVTGEQITSIAATRSGHGYWLFSTRGRVLPFGDARFFGDMHTTRLRGPVVSAVATPTGAGYYMVGTDGGVFTFGDAKFRGSMATHHLNAPVIALVPTAANNGYWLVASDGGVFTFSAPFLGSAGGIRLATTIVGMDRYGAGYLMVATDGGIFNFSHQPYFGSLGATPPTHPVVDVAATS